MAKKKSEPKEKVTINLNNQTMEVGKIHIEDIITFCKENNEIAWLKDIAKKEFDYKDKKTGEDKKRKISFIEIRNEFLRKFYPDEAPKSEKVEKKTFYDLIDEL